MKTFPYFPRSMPNLHSLTKSRPFLQEHLPPPPGDPFKLFPPTLKYLSLNEIPLYQSLLNIRSLTKFTLSDPAFACPLDTLLTFLEDNASLKHVELYITFATSPSSRRQAPIKNQLHHLLVKSTRVEDIQALISYIPLQQGGALKIISCDFDVGWENILPDINTVYSKNLLSPTYLWYNPGTVQLSGPNGSFQLYGPSKPEQNLTGLSPLSFGDIQELHLELPGSVFPDFSLFPTLNFLTVDYNGNSNMLHNFLTSLLSPESCSLKTLTFQLCVLYPGDFMGQLIQFASNCKNMSAGLDHIVIICRDQDKFPSSDLVTMLGKYVQDVKLLDHREPPKDFF